MIKESNARSYCCEDISKIENYDKAIADTTQTWLCHHRLETHNSDGERRLVDLSHKELIALGMYYHRSASELIFLERDEHSRLHAKSRKYSEETRAKLSKALKGKPAPNKGKHHSEETKRKMAEAHKGKSSGTKGKHWKLVDGKRVWY